MFLSKNLFQKGVFQLIVYTLEKKKNSQELQIFMFNYIQYTTNRPYINFKTMT